LARRRSGGRPLRARRGLEARIELDQPAIAVSRSASVWMKNDMTGGEASPNAMPTQPLFWRGRA
jgi:hypothetical protein